ncbi:glycosyltransferase [Bacillus sp. AFS018417]|uniref:glycosyltransferase n=1 Tax=Bacillus sp. AFS018417 TaxID=2033491 RepID=UPI000BF2E2A1|nr:glycosyltransferase [Bacillus sp. AFS018417]PEZ01827.1 glycosyltransferase [Bacillus sp. AFS018417]
MVKTQTIPFRSFMDQSYKMEPVNKKKPLKKIITLSGGSWIIIVPKIAFAATVNTTFGNVHGAIMNAFDSGVVLVIIFSGASWALGHRTKALEILIGVCCGYILARHAIDIRDFLKNI